MNEKDGSLQQHLTHLDIIQDAESRAVWVELKYHTDRPCFTPELLKELQTVQRMIQQTAQTGYEQNLPGRLLFQVLTSSDRRAFSLGEDLSYIDALIEAGDREGLMRYAKTLIDIQYSAITHYDIPFTTIALIQGEALGGGFEAALSSNVIVAEVSARFGFPELTFGMGPGPSAILMLTRNIAPAMARRIIGDRRVRTAGELYEIGVVDVLAPDGEGREAVQNYMQRHSAIAPGLHYLQAAFDCAKPVSYEELSLIAEHWVDATLQMSEKNRRLMSYFARAQNKRQTHPPAQDRRGTGMHYQPS